MSISTEGIDNGRAPQICAIQQIMRGFTLELLVYKTFSFKTRRFFGYEIKTTQIYAKTNPKAKRKTLEKMNTVIMLEITAN